MTANPQALRDLLERVTNATGPDRKLLYDVWRAIVGDDWYNGYGVQSFVERAYWLGVLCKMHDEAFPETTMLMRHVSGVGAVVSLAEEDSETRILRRLSPACTRADGDIVLCGCAALLSALMENENDQ